MPTDPGALRHMDPTPPIAQQHFVVNYCPCCGLATDDPDRTVMCGTCRALHHLECWEANGGCCTPSCPAAPARVVDATPGLPATAGGAPYERGPASSPWEERSLAHYGSWPWVISLLLLVIFLSTVVSLPIVFALMLQTGDPQAIFNNPFFLFVVVLLEDAVFIGVVYVLLVRRRVTSWREMGLRGLPSLRSVGLGLLWGIAFIAVSATIELLLRLVGVQQTQAAQFPIGRGGIAGTVAIWIAGIILAPFTEEIFFRGFLFRAIAMRKGLLRGIVYSSVIFGIVHLNLPALLPITAGAALLAIAYHRSDNLWVPIIAHALNNLFAFLLLTLAVGT